MKHTYTAVVVDDERLARKDLIAMLSRHSSISVVGEADDVPSAARVIAQLNPDVVFLDIQMPGQSGFDLLKEVSPRSRVIFVTAHDAYAVRGFEVNALDYLLKPVSPARLAQAVARIATTRQVERGPEPALGYDDSIYLRVDRTMMFVKVSTIIGIRSAGDYSEVITKELRSGLTDKTMREWERRLPVGRFCRIHRSAIINLGCVERIEEVSRYTYRVYLIGTDRPFDLSRRYAARLKRKLG